MRPSSKSTSYLLLVCLAVLLCLTPVSAQSGRKGKKPPAPVPAPTTSQEPSPDVDASQIKSIVIVGHDVDPDSKEIWSNDTSIVAKACTERLKEHPKFSLEIIYGGKLLKSGAVERAKRETNAYVLWFGYRSKLVGLDYTIDYIDYVVMFPQTAKTLAEGRVYPARQRTSADPGGILRLPTRNSRRQRESVLLEIGGKEIAERIKNLL